MSWLRPSVTRYLLAAIVMGLIPTVAGCGGGGAPGGGNGGTDPTGSVTGLVVTIDGQGVEDAKVTVVGTGLLTTTDTTGQYRLDKVPVGWQTIEVVKAGMVATMGTAVTRDAHLVAPHTQSHSAPTKLPLSYRTLREMGIAAPIQTPGHRVGPAATNDAMARTRVAVKADAVVRAPDVVLTSKAANVDWISVPQLMPDPGQALTAGNHVTITASVNYRLASSDRGEIRLFLMDEWGAYLADPTPSASVTIGPGEGQVTLTQTVLVPKGAALVQPVVALYSGDAPLTFVWTYPPAYPVAVFGLYAPGAKINNIVAHPERNEVYVALDYLYGSADELVVINTDSEKASGFPTVPNPGPLAISDDGKAVYVGSLTDRKIAIYDTIAKTTRTLTVGHPRLVDIAPITDEVIAYIYDSESSYNGAVILNTRTGVEKTWFEPALGLHEVATIPQQGIVYITANGFLEKWQYNPLQDTIHFLKKGTGYGAPVLIDKQRNFLFCGKHKIDMDMEWIYSHTPGYSGRLIALSTNGEYVLDDHYIVYETSLLLPIIQFSSDTLGESLGAFTPDGLVWIRYGDRLIARRIP